MLNRYARALFTAIFTPVARLLLRIGVGPDAVTFVGTLGVVVGSLAFFPRGSFFVGTLVVTAFVFSDLVDGTMARMSQRSSDWGAFLDSTLDRLGDAAVFGGISLWYLGRGHDTLLGVLALYCLAMGAAVSYAKARAEGLGMTANVGIAERADRLVTILVATGLTGLGVPYLEPIALWALAAGATITLGQRMVVVRRQAFATRVPTAAASSPEGSAVG